MRFESDLGQYRDHDDDNDNRRRGEFRSVRDSRQAKQRAVPGQDGHD
jgi:hypothetical protein